MLLGHSLSNGEGVILSIDRQVASMLHHDRDRLQGQSYLAITHADDQARNIAQVASLDIGASPILIRKRYLTGEGKFRWVDVQVSRLAARKGSTLLLGSFEIPIPEERGAPRTLWSEATQMLTFTAARRRSFGADLIDDYAWELLLWLYVAEAEGKPCDFAAIAESTGLSGIQIKRWLNVLLAQDLVEMADGTPGTAQLTDNGLSKLEGLLTDARSGPKR